MLQPKITRSFLLSWDWSLVAKRSQLDLLMTPWQDEGRVEGAKRETAKWLLIPWPSLITNPTWPSDAREEGLLALSEHEKYTINKSIFYFSRFQVSEVLLHVTLGHELWKAIIALRDMPYIIVPGEASFLLWFFITYNLQLWLQLPSNFYKPMFILIFILIKSLAVLAVPSNCILYFVNLGIKKTSLPPTEWLQAAYHL